MKAQYPLVLVIRESIEYGGVVSDCLAYFLDLGEHAKATGNRNEKPIH